jgi:hypothetical protein
MKSLKILFALALIFGLPAIGLVAAQQGAPDTAPLQPDLPGGINWSFQSDQGYDASPDLRAMWTGDQCDLNNDGYDDLVVGKRDYNSPTLDNGIAWLFLGSASGLPATPSLTFNPPYNNTYGLFGTQVRCGGNLNGDVYDDLVIGMDNYDNPSADEGAVFVYYGGNPMDATYDWRAEGDSTYAHFGISADGAGDVNGDGYDDLIVGANGNDSPGVTTAAYLWYGGAGGLGANGSPTNADWKATDGTLAMRWAGLVAGLGDVNGDGWDDVLVGASNYDGGHTNQGAVFVYYGSAGGLGATGTTANADWKAMSLQDNAYFGWSADGIGDVNGDGYDDLAVGAYAYDNGEANEGMLFVWYGASGGLGPDGSLGNADWYAETNQVSATLGWSVAPAHDVNGDGYDDLLATGYGFTANSGGWLVWAGGPNGLIGPGTPQNALLSGYSDQAGSLMGRENATALDANGDGLADIFVAACRYSNPEASEGMAFGYTSTWKLYIPLMNR